MTFKRIMLVVLPFLAAVFVFMIIRWVYRDWEASLISEPVSGHTVPEMPKEQAQMNFGPLGHGVSTNVNLAQKDRDGRTEMRFLADRIEHKSAKSADIDHPRFQFFTKGGEVITLLADQGRAVTKGAITNIANIESGTLWGHVVLIHDRGTPDDHSDDITVSFNDLQFTGDLYELSTDGPVVMSGLDIQLTACKMRIALDRKTRRINTMTFLEDIFIVMNAGDKMKMGLLGPMEPSAEGAAPGPKVAAATAATARPARPDAVAQAPAKAPAVASDRGDLWRIDLAGNVDARQQDQRLACDRLILYNQSARSPGESVLKEKAAGQKGAEAEPPAGRPGEKGSQEGAAAAAAKFLQPNAPPPLIVMADGPLIITPVADDERKKLGDVTNQVIATGTPVVVEDGQTQVVGAEVQYNTKTGSGSVIGKGSPILLDQPGRLHLTGGRLDFDRVKSTADVQGEGQLHALVQASSLTGTSKAKSAPVEGAPAAEDTSPLDATWTRGMRLEFYRLPANIQSGMGEIRRAVFTGESVLKQRDSMLKGDSLAIDFFETLAGRGQAVQRLEGHGNVFIKNAPPEQVAAATAAPAAKDSSRMAIGDITCQDLKLDFERDAAGDTQPKHLKASGAVEINDPSGNIRAGDLTVAFGPAQKGGGVEARFLEAFGNVSIKRDDLNAEGDHVRRDLAAGTLLLEGRPARASRGQSRIVGPRVEFAQADGRASVRGAGELEMPATTDLRGRPRTRAEPMLVKWQNSMLYEDKRNFAQFDGGATALSGGSRLASERLWVYFAEAPDKAAPGAAGATTKAPSAKDKAAKGDELGQFFGRKALVRVFAEKEVRAVDQQLAPDGSLKFVMEMVGDNLTYLEDSRKAYMHGPGRLRILARERPRTGEVAAPGLLPNTEEPLWTGPPPEGYARTEIGWTDSMAYDGGTDRAYFKGDIEAINAGRGLPGEGAAARRRATETKVRSDDLQVVFIEKTPPEPAKTPAATAAVPREERMSVEKFAADGNVHLWVDDRRGSAARLIYQREPEVLRLYRGTDDWARLWQENEATQEFGEIAARIITYEPSSGRVEVVEQQMMVISPKPKAPPPPKKMPLE